jgi:DNA-binding transcriptional MerR regulator
MNINLSLYRWYYKKRRNFKKMEKSNKKIVGGLIVVMLIVTIGAVIVSATGEDDIEQSNFWSRRQMCRPGPFISNSTEPLPFFSNLTEEQQAEINELITSLKDQGTNFSEIRAAIKEKLEEWGVELQIPELTEEELDERLDNAIERNEQRLEILYREKELRDEGYTWDEIRDIIQEEFDLEFSAGEGQGMMFGHGGFHCGPCRGSRGFMSDGEPDL